MISVLDKKRGDTDTPKHTSPTDMFDPWADWKPARSLKGAETPHDFQERHSPTESVNIRITSERHDTRSQRRITDARLWDALSPTQQDAALHIAFAYETMGRGLGFVTSNWQRLPGSPGSHNIAESHARLISVYVDWAQACQKQKIHHSMIIDILVFGQTLAAIDRDRRIRKGTARQNLIDGLTLYCKLQGWQP